MLPLVVAEPRLRQAAQQPPQTSITPSSIRQSCFRTWIFRIFGLLTLGATALVCLMTRPP